MIRSLILWLANVWSALKLKLGAGRLKFRWLELELKGQFPEAGGGFDLLSLVTGRADSDPAFLDVLTVLRAAQHDDQLETILLRIGSLECGFARVQEIALALSEVRDAGKKIIAVSEHLGLKEYLLASEADRIVIAPQGGLAVAGIGADVTFLRGALDKLGVEPQLLHRGQYKSASEMLTETGITEPHRRMLDELLGDLYSQAVNAIARRRSKTPEQIRAAFDEGPLSARRALELGLVDALGFPQEERDEIRKLCASSGASSGGGDDAGADDEEGETDSNKYGATYGRYLAVALARARRELKHPDGIALLHVSGNITSGEGVRDAREARSTGSRSFARAVEKIAASKRIKALVLRVNSPGGSGLASDVMLHALGRLKIPVVVSMGDTAASGGYYVACDRRFRVYADPGTITGSIGVISGKVAVAGLYEKLGLGHAHVGHGKNSDYFSAHTPWTPEQLKKAETEIDEFYRDFVQLVAQARGKSFDDTHAVAQGRVWSGSQAREAGLIDELGGLRAALDAARTLAKLPEGPVRIFSRFQKRPRLPLKLAVDFPDEPVTGLLKELELWQTLTRDRVLALLPWRIRIY